MFRPSDVGVGADGAIYVADWFDGRVGGHADWDETLSGTIYRIAPGDSNPGSPRSTSPRWTAQFAGLRSPAVNVRGRSRKPSWPGARLP